VFASRAPSLTTRWLPSGAPLLLETRPGTRDRTRPEPTPGTRPPGPDPTPRGPPYLVITVFKARRRTGRLPELTRLTAASITRQIDFHFCSSVSSSSRFSVLLSLCPPVLLSLCPPVPLSSLSPGPLSFLSPVLYPLSPVLPVPRSSVLPSSVPGGPAG